MLDFVPFKGTKSAKIVPFKGIFEYLAYGYYPSCTPQAYAILAPVRDDTGGLRGFGKIENGIVVRDDIEYGHSQFIPLWNFGLNY